MFERFTDRARRVVELSQEEARLKGRASIGTYELLISIVVEGESVGFQALRKLGVEDVFPRPEHSGTKATGHLPFTTAAKKALETAMREALQLGHNYIGPEHLLLGLCRAPGDAQDALHDAGVDLVDARKAVIELLAGYDPAPGQQEPKFGVDDVEVEAMPFRSTTNCAKCRCSILLRVYFAPKDIMRVICESCGAEVDELPADRSPTP